MIHSPTWSIEETRLCSYLSATFNAHKLSIIAQRLTTQDHAGQITITDRYLPVRWYVDAGRIAGNSPTIEEAKSRAVAAVEGWY